MPDQKLKILFVDDDVKTERPIMERFAEALATRGIALEYEFVESASEARARLDTMAEAGTLPDAVMMDHMFRNTPDTRGTEHMRNILVADPRDYDKKIDYFLASASSSRIEKSETYQWLLKDSRGVGCIGKSEIIALTNAIYSPPLQKAGSLYDYVNEKTGLDIPTGKREAKQDNVRDAVEKIESLISQVGEGKISTKDALSQITPEELKIALRPVVLHRTYDPKVTQFANSSSGVTRGHAAFNEEQIEVLKAESKQPILILDEYTPDMLPLIAKAHGIIVLGSGSTHLLKICQAMGKPCLTDVEALPYGTRKAIASAAIETIDGEPCFVDKNHRVSRAILNWELPDNTDPEPNLEYEGARDDFILKKGDEIAIANGELVASKTEIELPPYEIMKALCQWIGDLSRQYSLVSINASADSYTNIAKNALYQTYDTSIEDGDDTYEIELPENTLSIANLGLIRTEHLLVSEDEEYKPHIIRNAIMADTPEARAEATKALGDAYQEAFKPILHSAAHFENRCLRIRLLEPTIEDFFNEEETAHIRDRVGADNMRGVQLAAQIEGLYENQLAGIFEAFVWNHQINTMKRTKEEYHKGNEHYKGTEIEIMVPHVQNADELAQVKEMAERIAREKELVFEDGTLAYKFGSMIETLEACDNIEEIAQLCDFVSFGTNDLTAEILGLDRDDGEAIAEYENQHGFNPFKVLAPEVKAKLTQVVGRIRSTPNPPTISLCGDQGMDMDSLLFLDEELKLDSVSIDSSTENLIATPLLLAKTKIERSKKESKGVTDTNVIDMQLEWIGSTPKTRPAEIQALLDKPGAAEFAEVYYKKHGIPVSECIQDSAHDDLFPEVQRMVTDANEMIAPSHIRMPMIFAVEDSIMPITYESNFHAILIREDMLSTLSRNALLGSIAHEIGEAVHFELGEGNLSPEFDTGDREHFADHFGASLVGKQSMISALEEIEALVKLPPDALAETKSMMGLADDVPENTVYQVIYQQLGVKYPDHEARVAYINALP